MFVFPHGATVDAQGNLWVTDEQGKDGKGQQVFKFSPDGKVLMTLGKAGVASDAPGLFDQPTDVAIAANGDIFVTEGHLMGNNRVSKFSKDGKFIKVLGTQRLRPRRILRPPHYRHRFARRLFVGDRSNNRIQVFDQDGNYLDTWMQFGRPSGIFIAKDDTMYVADSESWGKDEPGWKKGIRIGSARDGSVKYFIPDMESTTEEHSGAEGVASTLPATFTAPLSAVRCWKSTSVEAFRTARVSKRHSQAHLRRDSDDGWPRSAPASRGKADGGLHSHGLFAAGASDP